ncbi:autotransporter outer membrane beta-barrel domain-containing protein [Xenorhabdus sp. KJ12.1]|uniref:autotransporter outer membrane beta-barrel domain-containing protein n=1 Tax=Xenorhabdus sp. KJ12.1 TaxID=1851571 RepID=UPI000C050775|nr:autotransporter domain-containing protein [Xenorhabdus sp. KJ12.1]PHM68422.1 outer membrane esterase [Xenorhabdus sp. KJ12.1]
MKKSFLFAPALLALSVSTVSYAKTYNKVYVFGDSLSDIGNNGCYTTKYESDICLSYTKYLAQRWMNKELISSDNKGTNYARGRATATWEANTEEPNNTTQSQLDEYYASTNGKADPNGIYIHWIGGNDLAAALIAGQSNPDKAHYIVKNSAAATAAQINELVKRGAGLVIVQNVPDVGTTPRVLNTLLRQGIFNQVLDSKLKERNISLEDYTKLSEQDKKNITQEIENSDGYKAQTSAVLTPVRDGLNGYDTPSGAIRRTVLEGVLKKMAEKTANVDNAKTPADKAKAEAVAQKIYEQLITIYDKASKGGTNLTEEYNALVEKGISENKGNILRADINGLLNEVIENPTPYGISNTLGYECPQGQSSTKCTITEDEIRKFLFSDDFHPTPIAQRMIDQYIYSTLIAPSQVMTLNQVNRTPVKGTRASLDGHLQQLRHTGNEQGKFGVFGSYTDNRHDSFTLGGDYQLAENFLLGALYSNNKFDRSSVSNFTYEGNGHVATGYALWNIFDNAWLSGDIHYARINYDSLTRSIQLGQANRKETGSTTGKQWGARLTANWDIPVTDIVTTSPIVQFSWDKGDVKGYRESGDNSSAMHFSDQNYTSKVGTLGWRVDTQLGRFNPYASIQFNHQFGDTQYKLSSAINSTKTLFVTDSSKQSRDWRQYTIGANANLFGNIHGFASVTRNEGSSQDANYNFSLGVSSRF